jgi:hypothetical protein
MKFAHIRHGSVMEKRNAPLEMTVHHRGSFFHVKMILWLQPPKRCRPDMKGPMQSHLPVSWQGLPKWCRVSKPPAFSEVGFFMDKKTVEWTTGLKQGRRESSTFYRS